MSHLSPEAIEAAAAATGAPDAHLEGCGPCRQAVSDARGRQRLLRGLTPYTLSEIGFRRVGARLGELAEEGFEPAISWRWLVLGASVAAVAAMVLVASRTEVPDPVTPVATQQEVPAPWRALTVVQASADAKRHRGQGWQPVQVGDVLQAGDGLSGSVVLAAGEWVFRLGGAASVGGAANVALGAGQLDATIHSGPAVVTAGPRRLQASEASFSVHRFAAEVVIELTEGTLDAGDAVFRAPVRVRWVDGAGPLTEPLAAAPPRDGLRWPAGPWGRLSVADVSAGAAIDIDGQRVGVAPLQVLWSLGRHRVRVTAPGVPPREAWLKVSAEGVAAFPRAELDEGPGPDDAALARVADDVRRQRAKLGACYEKWLKANPAAAGEVVLALRISARGHVLGARVEGGSFPKASVECLERAAKGLVLSPLGAPAELEVPLHLTPSP